MQQQKLCLKWNNHTANLLEVLGTFRQTDILVDVTISCEGRNIKAHKMVLSACSPYFQNIFLENPCQHPIVIINGMKYEDVTAILNFMYKGEVNVSHEGLSSFLQAAEALKVRGLAEVCGDKNSASQDSEQTDQPQTQRTDTPTKKRHRNRKRSLSDSNKSDDEGALPRKQKDINSPEVHDLSGDEAFTGDMSSNGQLNSRLRQNMYSRSHQSSNVIVEEVEDEYEVEPSKLMEQTLTTENVSMNNSTSSDNLRIEHIMSNATEMESSSLQEPDSPPDIKPIIEYGESSSGLSEGNILPYNEQSQPGPSSVQDSSLLHDNSHTQDILKDAPRLRRINNLCTTNKSTIKKPKTWSCGQCLFKTSTKAILLKHLNDHEACRHKTSKQITESGDTQQKVVQSRKRKHFKCCFCRYETRSEKLISDHLFSHEYVCIKCKKSFGSLEELNSHKKLVKSQAKLSNDDADSCQGPPNISLEAYNVPHIKIRNSSRSFVTKSHNIEIIDVSTDSSDSDEPDEPNGIDSPSDNDTNKTWGNLRQNSETVVSRPYMCLECDELFSCLEDLQRHAEIHKRDLFTCEICNTDFAARIGLDLHKQIQHPTKQCTACQQLFEDANEHSEHMKMHLIALRNSNQR